MSNHKEDVYDWMDFSDSDDAIECIDPEELNEVLAIFGFPGGVYTSQDSEID